MATGLSNDPSLLAKPLESSRETTMAAAPNMELSEVVTRREPMTARELFGRLEWSEPPAEHLEDELANIGREPTLKTGHRASMFYTTRHGILHGLS